MGILDLDLQISDIRNVELEQENFKMKRQLKVKEEKYKAFLDYARKWWNDFLYIRSSHSKRLVKIFVNSETGKNVVSSFIFPIKGKIFQISTSGFS